MSASGEPPADEDPGVAEPDGNENNDILNNSDADTEPAMIEEEEMPTYMSVTSSSRLDESSRAELEIQRHPESGEIRGPRPRVPYADDEQAGECVYVVSSGDESERRVFDDDDMEDYESDEIDEEEEEEEDDEDDSRLGANDEDDSDADVEQFERSSDDYNLKYDSGLEKHHKARSRSLQDLTNSRSNLSRFVGKRRSIDLFENYSTGYAAPNAECFRDPERLRDPLGDSKKISRPKPYAGVQSKVKKYIQDIKDQNRRSTENKLRENLAHRNFNESKADEDAPCTRLNPANRLIKGYAQNSIKQIIAGIPEEARGAMEGDIDLPAEIIPQIHTEIPNNLSKNERSNGLIDYSMHNHVEKIVEPMETCATNGQEQIAAIFNLRTLSYEEYANGDEITGDKFDTCEALRPIIDEKNGVTEFTEEQVVGTTETETARVPTSLKNEIVKTDNTVPEEAHGARESSDFPKSANHEIEGTNRDGTDVAMLWAMLNKKTAQLNEKTAQYDGIRDAFQKTLTENISMKREMEELKKTLAKYRKDNEPRETKVAAVQTEEIIQEIEEPKIAMSESKAPLPKLLSTSVGSALSSIEQWSDSNCSPAISINPPNMDNVLNSDDSMIGGTGTPCRPVRQMSQSFITSSRILQTLANITQGRTRATSSLATRNVDSRTDAQQGQSKRESNISHACGNESTIGRSKKRKASDMLSPSDYSQSFKIPYTPGEQRRKVNSDFETDTAVKSSREQSRNGGQNEQTAAGGSNVDESSERLPDDFEDNGGTDVPENVKCFVYQEEAGSKERSFLIQADDVPKDSPVGNKGGTVRECGPYLLGNVEIRMTEANGTINIWGKEISQCTDDLNVEEETEESEIYEKPSTSRRSSHDCQKTPRSKFANVNPFMCSTNKKSKDAISAFSRSGIGKYFRPAFANMTRTNNLVDEGQPGHYRSSPILNNRTSGCEHCESHRKPQRYNWPSCDHLANSRRKQQQHSCCIHGVEVNDRDGDCTSDDDCDVFDDDGEHAIFQTVSNILTNHNKCISSCHDASRKHSRNEETRRQQTSHNRHLSDETNCHHAKKRRSSNTGDIPSCNTRLTPGKAACCDNKNRSHSHPDSCEDDDHPLLSNGQHFETPETKRRRLSGKRVRGILTDLLRGCGGCREPNNTSFVAKETSSLPNLIPSVRITPCTPTSHPSCSKTSATYTSRSKQQPPRDVPNENDCSSCARRAAMTAEIENKLEILTVEMERMRSRSATFRGMLDLLNSETD